MISDVPSSSFRHRLRDLVGLGVLSQHSLWIQGRRGNRLLRLTLPRRVTSTTFWGAPFSAGELAAVEGIERIKYLLVLLLFSSGLGQASFLFLLLLQQTNLPLALPSAADFFLCLPSWQHASQQPLPCRLQGGCVATGCCWGTDEASAASTSILRCELGQVQESQSLPCNRAEMRSSPFSDSTAFLSFGRPSLLHRVL